MKNYIKSLVLILSLSFCFFACQDEVIEEIGEIETVESIVSVSPVSPNPIQGGCTGGYNVFPDNVEKDCGWKRGFDDYVFQYNNIVNRLELGPCFTTEVLGVEVNDKGESTVKWFAGSVSTGYIVPNLVAAEFQSYLAYITAHRNDSDFAMGKFIGYTSISGQEPLTSPNTNCSGGALPFQ